MRSPALSAIVGALAPAAAAWGVRALAWTLSVRRDERAVEPLWQAGAPVIYAVWHARILLLPVFYGQRPVRVLASRSRDGELVVRYVGRFGIASVRGSSSRGGASAFRALARWLKDGHEVLIVPDGPRGPAETVKPGIVSLARLSGASIVPVGVGASSEWRARSWDRFRIPRPFARCVIRFGDPIAVPRVADMGTDDGVVAELEAALAAVSRAADREAAS
jgi:lysophospholipid acyltransferase (LPLAT)-like uncharacterized protein